MVRENEKIRKAARTANIPLWAVANAIGVSEPTFFRWLRFPLPKEKERAILDAIKAIENGEAS